MDDSHHGCLLLVIQSPIEESQLIGSDDATINRIQWEVVSTELFWKKQSYGEQNCVVSDQSR